VGTRWRGSIKIGRRKKGSWQECKFAKSERKRGTLQNRRGTSQGVGAVKLINVEIW